MTIFWSPSVKLVLYLRQIEKKSKKIKSYNWFLEYSKQLIRQFIMIVFENDNSMTIHKVYDVFLLLTANISYIDDVHMNDSFQTMISS